MSWRYVVDTLRGFPWPWASAPLLFVVGGGAQYVGAALAVTVFTFAAPSVVAWLRMLFAAIVLVIWRRPDASSWRWDRLAPAAAFGVATAVMNIAFYEALARLPLGTAVAIEFLGPVAVAAFGSRTPRDLGALALVIGGVLLIADVRWAGSPLGVVLALVSALCWAAYIVLGKRLADRGRGLDDLAVGFVVATVLLSPLVMGAGAVLTSPRLLGVTLAVGVLSTAVPYVLDQIVLRRVGRVRFSLLLALLPVTATVIGFLTPHQRPAVLEFVGIGAVVLAVVLGARPLVTEGS